MVRREKGKCYLPLNTVAKAGFLATTEAGADGRLDALIPAPVSESMDG